MSVTTVVMATRNAHKLHEVRTLLEGTGVEVVGMPPELADPPEDHDTFEANALQKARHVWEALKAPAVLVVADDSGIEVAALGGAPGVFSKRFTPEGTDEANNQELLRRLEGCADRRARYRCVLALVAAEGHSWLAAGTCEGHIGSAPRGASGFGYDPLFWPDSYPGRTMAEVSLAEKNAVSHRGRAFARLPALVAEALPKRE